MKTFRWITAIIIAFMLMEASTTQIQAQSFLKKINNALDQVNKTLEQVNNKVSGQGTDATSSQKSDQNTNPFANIIITTPTSDIKVQISSCRFYGNDVVIEYVLTNSGQDLKSFLMDMASAYDNLGNKYYVKNQFGNNYNNSSYQTAGEFPPNIPIKTYTRIFGVNANATQINLVKIAAKGYLTTSNSSKLFDGELSFKNVPIQKESPASNQITNSSDYNKTTPSTQQKTIPDTLKTAKGIYLIYTYGNDTWMVSNSKEGNPEIKKNPQAKEKSNGYYYWSAEISKACPSSWHLPNETEWNNLMKIINANKSAASAKWWLTNAGNAFAGSTIEYDGLNWSGWGESGCWWCSFLPTSTPTFFSASTKEIIGPDIINKSAAFSVRCVKDRSSSNASSNANLKKEYINVPKNLNGSLKEITEKNVWKGKITQNVFQFNSRKQITFMKLTSLNGNTTAKINYEYNLDGTINKKMIECQCISDNQSLLGFANEIHPSIDEEPFSIDLNLNYSSGNQTVESFFYKNGKIEKYVSQTTGENPFQTESYYNNAENTIKRTDKTNGYIREQIYDSKGNLISNKCNGKTESLEEFEGEDWGEPVTKYDTKGRLIMYEGNGSIKKYSYNTNNFLTLVQISDHWWGNSTSAYTVYTYDTQKNWISRTVKHTGEYYGKTGIAYTTSRTIEYYPFD